MKSKLLSHHFLDYCEFHVCNTKLLELNVSSTVQILENIEIESDSEKGKNYFEGSVKFMKTLNEVLDMLIDTVCMGKLAKT